MDSIYNELYGLYYFMLERILQEASKCEISLKYINHIVSRYGFSESNIYFTPDLVSQGGKGYNLLKASDSGYSSILKSSPVRPLTSLQKGFIKSMLQDRKLRLFLEEAMVKELEEALSDVPPLFHLRDIVLKETALDSDDFEDEQYILNFRRVLSAIQSNKAMWICFNNSRGERKTMKLAPYKLEYGIRDDKFRICGVCIYDGIGKSYVKVNLARVLSITLLEQSFDFDFEAFISAKRKPEPIEIEVYNVRNGFERVFIGLSNYERVSSFHEGSGKCRLKIYYSMEEQQELLIQLMSYGPAIKVLGPSDFKARFVERVQKQFNMLNATQP